MSLLSLVLLGFCDLLLSISSSYYYSFILIEFIFSSILGYCLSIINLDWLRLVMFLNSKALFGLIYDIGLFIYIVSF